jgi:hypothetical protein
VLYFWVAFEKKKNLLFRSPVFQVRIAPFIAIAVPHLLNQDQTQALLGPIMVAGDNITRCPISCLSARFFLSSCDGSK